MKRIRPILVFVCLFLFLFQPVHTQVGARTQVGAHTQVGASALTGASAQDNSPLVLVMNVDSPIFPNIRQYIERGIKVAEQRDAEVLVIQLDTPGGDLLSTFDIMQAIRTSRVPVVIYVAPRGGAAFSAGAIITLAGHAAAMAPETAIGAASPVSSTGEDLGETIKAKEIEGIKAQLRELVERRGQKAAKLANEMVDNARAVSASEALDVGLVDFIAEDVDDLLGQLDGFSVEMPDGERVLHTKDASVESLPMTILEQLLNMLTNPNIIILLTTIGVQAVLIEISSPGGWVAGFIGVICLALAAYGYGILPVNWFGIIFFILAFVLFILDIKAPTHGALTAAGIGSFIVGAMMLFNTPVTPPYLHVSVPLVVIIGIFTGTIFAVILGFVIRAWKTPIRTGRESLIRQVGRAKTAIAPHGQVQVSSELWTAELAEGQEPIRKGEQVEVVEVDGLRLKVQKKR